MAAPKPRIDCVCRGPCAPGRNCKSHARPSCSPYTWQEPHATLRFDEIRGSTDEWNTRSPFRKDAERGSAVVGVTAIRASSTGADQVVTSTFDTSRERRFATYAICLPPIATGATAIPAGRRPTETVTGLGATPFLYAGVDDGMTSRFSLSSPTM